MGKHTTILLDDDSDIPDSGAAFTFGKNRTADKFPSKFWIRNDQPIKIACGDQHTAIVAESGRIFMFGNNAWGQLGLGHKANSNKPSCIKQLKNSGEKVTLVACGRNHTVCATESGKLFGFGSNSDSQLGIELQDGALEPQLIDSVEPQRWKMLAAGADFTLALTESGEVYAWGGGESGQLGLGHELEFQATPVLLRMEEKIVCIGCGYYHSAFVTESGKLLVCGDDEDTGKLGLDPAEVRSGVNEPREVPFDEPVRWASCGGSHTAVVTESGLVYTFGDGTDGQLGQGPAVLGCWRPALISSLRDVKAVSVSCGESHTAVVTDHGQLYTFGDSRHGKLALGMDSYANQFRAFRVKRFNKFVVDQVVCGGCHTIVVAHRKLIVTSDSPRSDDSDNPTVWESANFVERQTLNRTPRVLRRKSMRRESKEDVQSDEELLRSLPHLTPAVDVQPRLLSTAPAPFIRSQGPAVANRRFSDSKRLLSKPDIVESGETTSLGSVSSMEGQQDIKKASLQKKVHWKKKTSGIAAGTAKDERHSSDSLAEKEITPSVLPRQAPPRKAVVAADQPSEDSDISDSLSEAGAQPASDKEEKKSAEPLRAAPRLSRAAAQAQELSSEEDVSELEEKTTEAQKLVAATKAKAPVDDLADEDGEDWTNEPQPDTVSDTDSVPTQPGLSEGEEEKPKTSDKNTKSNKKDKKKDKKKNKKSEKDKKKKEEDRDSLVEDEPLTDSEDNDENRTETEKKDSKSTKKDKKSKDSKGKEKEKKKKSSKEKKVSKKSNQDGDDKDEIDNESLEEDKDEDENSIENVKSKKDEKKDKEAKEKEKKEAKERREREKKEEKAKREKEKKEKKEKDKKEKEKKEKGKKEKKKDKGKKKQIEDEVEKLDDTTELEEDEEDLSEEIENNSKTKKATREAKKENKKETDEEGDTEDSKDKSKEKDTGKKKEKRKYKSKEKIQEKTTTSKDDTLNEKEKKKSNDKSKEKKKDDDQSKNPKTKKSNDSDEDEEVSDEEFESDQNSKTSKSNEKDKANEETVEGDEEDKSKACVIS